MKQTLLSALLASVFATPAYCDVVTMPEPHGGSITGDLMTGATPAPGWHWVVDFAGTNRLVGFTGPGFWDMTAGSAHNYPPGFEMGYVYRTPNNALDLVYSTVAPDNANSPPFDPFTGPVTMTTPVTVTDPDTGDRTTYDIVWSGLNMAVAIAAFYGADDPRIGLVLGALDVFVATYEPGKNATINGISNMVDGIISAGTTAMGASSVPIGPDPTADFDFWIMNTEFNGTFDYYGNLNNISGIHDLSLFVDNMPVSGSNNVPETSTWLLITIGFGSLALVAKRRRIA